MKTSIFATVGLAAAAGLLFATPAHAGITDGSLNDLHAVDHIAALSSNINSDPRDLLNNNTNSRAEGKANHANGQHE
ncbi:MULTISPECIES: hypothetical protein [Streptomyces]|uniref:hypothetical protein n=1 Tax=Streptomyces TaxID=1883 RepID=UPI000F554918|nr:hypothetical protein [Streptomyces sp. ADI97-07]RPK69478.1 hypothetical protein EES45_36580 [Streptomyces sp. ADI97-07]